MDISVTVICQSPLKEVSEHPDLKIRQTRHLTFPYLKEISLVAYSLFLLVSTIHRESVDVVYVRSEYNAIFSRAVTLLLGIPQVVEVNGLIVSEQGGRLDGSLRRRIGYLLRIALERSYVTNNHVITVTENIANHLKRNYGIPQEKISVINNGANVDLFKPIDRDVCIDELGLSADFRYLCFVGYLEYWQGVEYLIEALPIVLREHPKTRILIVGNGPEEDKLRNLASSQGLEEYISFVGGVSHSEVPRYINACDICITYKIAMESGYSPLKLYEYMACAKPVIASDVDGFEVIDEYGVGVLVEPENEEKLAAAINRCLSLDPSELTSMGNRGRELVVKDYNWEEVSKRVTDVCRTMVTLEPD